MATLTSGAQRGPRRDHALFERYCSTRDRASREALVERFLPLAQHLARQYPAGGEQEDLMQVASLALVKAIDRFDPVTRHRVHVVRGADDRRRAQALLPRPRLGGPHAA